MLLIVIERPSSDIVTRRLIQNFALNTAMQWSTGSYGVLHESGTPGSDSVVVFCRAKQN